MSLKYKPSMQAKCFAADYLPPPIDPGGGGGANEGTPTPNPQPPNPSPQTLTPQPGKVLRS